MRQSSRLAEIPKLNYQVLNSTGKIKYKEANVDQIVEGFSSLQLSSQQVIQESTMTAATDEAVINFKCLEEDILDFIDEKESVVKNSRGKDIDLVITRLELLRSKYRSFKNQLEFNLTSYEDDYSKNYQQTILQVKTFIKFCNEVKSQVTFNTTSLKAEEQVMVQRAIDFQIINLKRLVEELIDEINVDVTKLLDAEVIRRNKNVPDNRARINKISAELQDLFGKSITSPQIDDLTKRYEKLQSFFHIYSKSIISQFDRRDLEKEKLFKESHLNIKLIKFKGYVSSTDIYSFQSDFEKLYLRTTPRHLLPDLLKNNFLEEPALSLVKHLDNIKEIWERLTMAYGSTKILLEKKLDEINNINQLWKYKDPEKIMDGLSVIISTMRDLISLSKKHNIESKLFNGNGIEKIYMLLGDTRVTRWLTACDDELDGEELWLELIVFLEKDLKVQQQRKLIYCKVDEPKAKQPGKDNRTDRNQTSRYGSYAAGQVNDDTSPGNNLCHICKSTDHINTNGPYNSKIVQYFACKQFVDMNPSQRFLELKKKNLCFQCLYPGADRSKGKHKEGRCQRDFACPHESHDRYHMKKHILVCDEHKNDQQNQQLLEQYKAKYILKSKSTDLPAYSKEIRLSFHSSFKASNTSNKKLNKSTSSTVNDSAIYLLQEIEVNQQNFLIFFDSGCSDFVLRYDCIERLKSNANLEFAGPIKLGGVGDVITESPYGVYSAKLPLFNGSQALLTGVAIEKITTTFPKYPIQGKVQDDICAAYKASGGDVTSLPNLPKEVGGDVHLMIGIKYLRYHPEVIFQLPSGLTIYQSLFLNPDGSRGVIGGPHHTFSSINQHYCITDKKVFISNQYQIYKNGLLVNPDISLLSFKQSWHENDGHSNAYMKAAKIFEKVEEAGSEITFRCIKCRSCKDCKDHNSIETISIREEVEQDVINKSVNVNPENQITIASLPLMYDPMIRLAANKHKALKVYQQQVKKLSKQLIDKQDVIQSESKLQELGHVEFVKNLSSQQQLMLKESPVQNFIPWRAVWKANSLSTPCRLVFDASQPTDTGFSLNNILAKGRNSMNNLAEIMIRWYTHKIAFHTDIRKMYNTIKLKEDNWCFQRYIWQNELDAQQIPEEKIIKTLIYGVKSSGNQAEYGLRQTAQLSKDLYPEINSIVSNDVYVDDCISGEKTIKAAIERADQMELVLSRGGFGLKGFTFTGKEPLESLSSDGQSISIAGMTWFPKDDLLSLDIGELNFAKKQRGKKPTSSSTGIIPSKLTRRHCVSKVSEIFDLTGKVTPLTAAMKLDLHNLVTLKLNWDDTIPDNLRPVWESHFEMMSEISSIKFKRTVIPDDAANLEISTIDFADASKSIACVAVYTRILRTNGEFSCQLLFSRSKLVPDQTSQPRAELIAAVLNTHTGEVVRKSLKDSHKRSIKITDSQIVLHWLNNDEIALKQWVRNRVLEVRRYTDPSIWRYINTSNMLADIGTRRGAKLSDVDQSSLWINGADWMKHNEEDFPLKTVSQIILTNSEQKEVNDEAPTFKFNNEVKTTNYIADSSTSTGISAEVQKRYAFSNYVIDPNKFHFKKVLRILAIVIKFVTILQYLVTSKTNNANSSKISIHEGSAAVYLTDDEIKKAESYFYKKGSKEVIKFVKESKYKHITQDVDGILTYTGRILSTDEIQITTPMTNAMKDLQATTFCVPVLDKYSPLSYSIVNQIHWYDQAVRHSGIESVWRYTLKKVYIIEGRDVVKRIKSGCKRCRYLKKKTIDVSMGKVPEYNLTIAPAFYVTQIDLAGPFKSYSNHHKRTTVKIWLAIFCCATTSTTSIKVMEDYSTAAFVQAFIRFSCEVGYPKKVLTDAGSQLIKGCSDLKLNFHDIKFKLHHNVSVEFDVCPVGGHNMNGKVERKIREIKSSLERALVEQRLSIIQWETISSEVANCINDLPLALGSIVSDFETLDIITPNRLRLGRNNNRSPVGTLQVTNNANKIIKSNTIVFNSWFDNWLVSHVPKIINQPKWFRNDVNIKIGDVVLFLKNDSVLSSTYQYGLVKGVQPGRDGKIRKAIITYRNYNESVNRETFRAVRNLVIIHHVDEINIIDELNEMYKTTIIN